jgi:septal ring factor EnvC (AmiA/AmiB activator)
MGFVNKGLILLIATVPFIGFGQSSDKLKKEQTKLEKEIKQTKNLLSKTKNQSEKSFNELKIIENQIKSREELVSNFDNQVRGAELKMLEKDSEVKQLQVRLKRLKVQYKRLLIYAYKHRSKFGRMMFIFSANSYNEALKRNEYLKRVSGLQQKQFRIIRQHQGQIKEELGMIHREKTYKSQLLSEKIKEKERIEIDKQQQEAKYKKCKAEEANLLAKLKKTEKQKEAVKKKINNAIQQEIAAAEKKKKNQKKESTTKKNQNSTSKNQGNTSSKSNTSSGKQVAITETKESTTLGKNFEGNKGQLPWPVAKGSITEKFGKNPHPTLDNVYTNNNGVDISTTKNAQMRAVFEGEVTSVLNIPGAGKVVIIKHGNYRTVYSNLQSTSVSVGSKVSTKQSIGTLLSQEGSSLSIAHFEIHLINGSSVQCLNPSLWINL